MNSKFIKRENSTTLVIFVSVTNAEHYYAEFIEGREVVKI